MGKQAEAEAEADDPGSVATKDVNAMYLVMRQRVAKMEARVDERLNQVNGLNSIFEYPLIPVRSNRCSAQLCCRWLSRWINSCSRMWTRSLVRDLMIFVVLLVSAAMTMMASSLCAVDATNHRPQLVQ